MFVGEVTQERVLQKVCHEAGKGTNTIFNSTGIIFSMDVQNSRNQLLIESQNHLAWKRPLQSSSLSIAIAAFSLFLSN